MPTGAPLTDRLRDLQRVYDEEFDAAVAIDRAVVRREALSEALDSELFLVGQALARDTQRLSGLPYVFPGGPPHRLSKGGQVLDGWLTGIGYSMAPGRPGRRYAYHSDLHPGFPGRRDTSGDLVPTIAQIEAGAGWLQREIEIIGPKAVVCLGKQPALDILRRYCGVELRKLSDATNKRWEIDVAGHVVAAFAVYHPSGAFQFPQQSARAWEFAGDELRQILTS